MSVVRGVVPQIAFYGRKGDVHLSAVPSFLPQLSQKRFKKRMPLFSKLPACLRIHGIFQEQQLIMEMLHGFLQWPSMFAAVRERSCDADGTEGIQPVSILDDLSFASGLDPITELLCF